jgi:hypothetical protein
VAILPCHIALPAMYVPLPACLLRSVAYAPELPEWQMEKNRYYVELPGDVWEEGTLMHLIKNNQEKRVGGAALCKYHCVNVIVAQQLLQPSEDQPAACCRCVIVLRAGCPFICRDGGGHPSGSTALPGCACTMLCCAFALPSCTASFMYIIHPVPLLVPTGVHRWCGARAL